LIKYLEKWSIISLLLFITGCATAYLTNAEQQALNEILEILDTSIIEAKEKIEREPDPTSPLGYFVESLDDKRKYVKEIEDGKIPFNEAAVSKVANEAKEIQTNIKNPVDRVLKTDVSFSPGKYKIDDLSEEGKELLNDFSEEVFDVLVKEQRIFFPDNLLIIVIKTIGYADEITPGAGLTDELCEKIDEELPQDPFEQRKILNKELSRRRAETVNEYIQIQLKANLKMPQVEIGESEIIGMGEEFPYPENEASPPYMTDDKRRRICKIYSNVFVDYVKP